MNKTDVELFEELNKSCRRFSVSKTEMPIEYAVHIVVYLGMGDFQEFLEKAPTFNEAASKALHRYKKFLGVVG